MLTIQIWENVKTGLWWGLSMALFVSALVTIQRVLLGAGPFERYETTYTQVVALYFLAGGSAGLIAGLLLPLGRWWLGAMLIGFISALPGASAIVLSMQLHDPLATRLTILIGAGILGPGIAHGFWREKKTGSFWG